MPSRASADAMRTCRSVGLKWNECPLPLQGDFPVEGS